MISCRKKFTLFIYLAAISLARRVFVDAVNFEDHSNGLPEDTCDMLAKSGNCEKDAATMQRVCAKTCYDRIPDALKFDVKDEEAFFSSTAKKWDGSSLDFDDYYGTLSVVINVEIKCDDDDETESITLSKRMDEIHSALTDNVEVFVFPFAKSDTAENIDPSKCRSLDAIISKNRKSEHIMEYVHINGPKTHPIYKFLKDESSTKEDQMPEDRMTFYFVNGEGTRIDMFPNPKKQGNFEGKLAWRLKDYIRKNLKYFKEEL